MDHARWENGGDPCPVETSERREGPVMVAVEETRSPTISARLGVVVTRVLVPLWLAAGVVLALKDASPSHMPHALITWLAPTGLDLNFVLRFGAGVELVVIGVILFLPRLARPVAAALLVFFVPILVGDLVMGAASCGCFGAVEVPPWLTLVMDLALLLGVWFLGARSPSLAVASRLPTARVVLCGLWALAAFAVSFGLVPAKAERETVAALPGEGYYVPDYETWVGAPWESVALAKYVRGTPDDLGRGEQFVLFYRKDCDHCHELMELYFNGPLEVPTTVVAVPERAGHPTTGVHPMPCRECRQAELPSGCDWFLKTPVLVRLKNGVVECVAEEDVADPLCLGW
jgi:hypothetical protein